MLKPFRSRCAAQAPGPALIQLDGLVLGLTVEGKGILQPARLGIEFEKAAAVLDGAPEPLSSRLV